MKATLQDFSNAAISAGFLDLFDFSVDSEILDLDKMTGEIGDAEGDKVIKFKILEVGTDTDRYGLTHLDTIIEYNGHRLKPFLNTQDMYKETMCTNFGDTRMPINERKRIEKKGYKSEDSF